jgi:hypothetical protein
MVSLDVTRVIAPPTRAPRADAGRPARGGARWLVPGCYLLGALVLTWRLWVDPASRMQTGDAHDVDLFAWFLRYSATAVSHGHLPALFTTTLNAPRGVNMMWNTAFLLPGVLLTPVTLLAGPQVSLTLALTASIAGSALSAFWVLRRWDASVPAAAIGGAVYGFSPALLNSGTGHYHLVLAVVPPLMIDAALRIVTGRGRPVPTGAWLGLLTAAQLFIGEEPLIDTAVAGLVLVGVIAASRPHAVPARITGAALGLGTGAAAALLLCAYPLWVQFRGPLREHSVLPGPWSGNLAYFIDPSGNLLFHTQASASLVAANNLGLPEVLGYLGWPLIVVLATAAIRYRRDLRVRSAAVTCAVLELCSLGGGPLTVAGLRLSGSFLPYHWLQGLPLFAQVLPDRFCILGAGAAGAALAFALDRARSGAPSRVRSGPAHRVRSAAAGQDWRRGVLPVAVACLALVPLLQLPYQAARPVSVPAGWQAVFARLRLAPGARVLVVPVPLVYDTDAMRWQADTGEPRTMIAGYFLGPDQTGQASFSIGPPLAAAEFLNQLHDGRSRVWPSSPGLVRSALAYWRPAAVVTVTGPASRLGRFLAGLLGRPSVRAGQVVAWDRGRYG